MRKFIQLLQNLRRLRNYLDIRSRSLTLKRFINILKAEYSRMKGLEKPIGLPFEFIIDPSNICQLRCPLCPTGSGTSRRKKGRMSFELFKDIVNQIEDYALHIFLYNWGEPLLAPNITDFIRYAVSKNIAVSISSNMSFPLSTRLAEDLLTSGLSTLIFSLDGASQEVYSKYRVGGDFELVARNIKILATMKKKLGLRKPVMEWQYLMMRHNVKDVKKAENLAKEWGVNVITFTKCVNLPFGKERANKGLAEKWFLPKEVHRRIYYDVTNEDVKSRRCWWLWRAMIVNWDGGVSPCCYVGDDENTDFGNLSQDRVKNIWLNEKYQKSRCVFKTGLLNSNTICSHCSVAIGIGR